MFNNIKNKNIVQQIFSGLTNEEEPALQVEPKLKMQRLKSATHHSIPLSQMVAYSNKINDLNDA